MNKIYCYCIFCSVFFISCSSQKKLFRRPITGLQFIGEYSLPHKMTFNGTTVGGLSSIDYNPAKEEYYLICDDRSDINPVRFYTAKISITANGIDTVQLISVTTLLQKNGEPYHNRKKDSLNVPDPEALRFNQKTGAMVWSSEGERIVRNGKEILTDPSVNISFLEGKLTDTFLLPGNMKMRATQNGPRNNGVFEGLAFADDYKTLYVSMEEPIYDDGPRAGLYDSAGLIRIIKYDVNTRLPVAQYFYPIDPVVQEPISPGLFIVNGVTDILAVNNRQLLVTERSFSTGRLGNNIRLYMATLEGADDVANVASVQTSGMKRPLRKKLVLDMDTLGRLIDNVEGATFGPLLANGKRSILFVTDDNFSPTQKTQFLLFQVE